MQMCCTSIMEPSEDGILQLLGECMKLNHESLRKRKWEHEKMLCCSCWSHFSSIFHHILSSGSWAHFVAFKHVRHKVPFIRCKDEIQTHFPFFTSIFISFFFPFGSLKPKYVFQPFIRNVEHVGLIYQSAHLDCRSIRTVWSAGTGVHLHTAISAVGKRRVVRHARATYTDPPLNRQPQFKHFARALVAVSPLANCSSLR